MKKNQTIIGATPFGPDLIGEQNSSLVGDGSGLSDEVLHGVSDEATLDGPGDSAEPLASEWRTFIIPAELHGQRLDRALASLVPEFSRSYLQQLVDEGAVRLDGRAASRNAQKVAVGQAGGVELRATPQSQAFVPEAMDLSVVYEDAHLLVIDKPAGLVVHPAPGNWRGTLLNGLLARDPRAALLPRAGIVHRLDKDTSGLMVVARDRQTMDALVKLIAAREVSRQYLALAHRPWQGPLQREVDAPIGRDPSNRLRMAVVDLARNSGKQAATLLECLGQGGPVSGEAGEGRLGGRAEVGCLVRASLRTGRTHQIRVHLAHTGHPLVGDGLYGGAPAAGMVRQALHAYRLAFTHPATEAPLSFVSPPPPDLAAALTAWGLASEV